jgi:hypothetical protein
MQNFRMSFRHLQGAVVYYHGKDGTNILQAFNLTAASVKKEAAEIGRKLRTYTA